MAFALKLLVTSYKLITVLFTPGILLTQLDPMAFTLPNIFCNGNLSTCNESWFWGILTLRIYIMSVTCYEACRYFPLFFSTCLYYFEGQIYALHMLSKMRIEADRQVGFKTLRWYNCIRISHQFSVRAWSSLAGITIAGGFVIFVTVNVVSLKCYNILPPMFYWMMPLNSGIAFLVSMILLTTLVRSKDDSEKVLKALKFEADYMVVGKGNVSSVNRKLVGRKLKACRVVQLRFFTLFPINREYKVSFFYDVFLRTVDGMMLPIF